MSGGDFARQADSFLDEGQRGQWFSAGRGPMVLPSGQTARLNITNPLGSGVLMMIHRYRIHVTTASDFVDVLVNPTTDLPVFALTSANRRVGMPNGMGQLFLDAGVPMSGGTPLPYPIPVETGGATFTEFLIIPTLILPPGFSIGTNFNNASGGNSDVVELLDWREIPL